MGLVRIRTEIFVNGQWVDISLHVLDRQALSISWGRKDYSSRATHTKTTPQINNKGGTYSRRNPYSPYFGQLSQNTQVRQSVQLPDGSWEFLHHSEIPSWPKRWDLSGNDAWTPVQFAGILRRLGQGKKPLKDALRRHIQANSPLQYWPLTDGEDAREGSEVAGGGQPMRSIGESGSFFQGQPNWAKGQLASHLDPVLEAPDATTGRIRARVNKSNVTSWTVDFYMTGKDSDGAELIDLFVADNGFGSDADPERSWELGFDAEFKTVSLFVIERGETTSSSTALTTGSTHDVFDGFPHMIRLTVNDDGAGGSDWDVILDGESFDSGNHGIQNNSVGKITLRWNTEDAETPGGTVPADAFSLGHITYWGSEVPPAIDGYRAMQGHVQELAGRRIERLCAEQGVPLQVTGDLDQTPAMGPQKPAKFLDLLRSAEDVDGGIVHEARDAFALAYRTNRSRYNQGV